MNTKLFALIAVISFFVTALPVHAMTTPILLMNSIVNINTITSVSARDVALVPSFAASGGSAITTQLRMPVAGTYSKIYLSLPVTLTTGTYAITLEKNGSATALTCTISSGANSCSDLSDQVSVIADDLLSAKVTVTGTPDVVSSIYAAAVFDGTTSGESYVPGAGTTLPTTAALNFGPLGFTAGANATEINRSVVFPTAGTLDRLDVKTSLSPNGAGNSWVFTLRQGVGGGTMATSTPTCTITNAGTSCNDNVNSASVAAGDTLSMAIQGVGTPRAGQSAVYAFRFTPTVDGESVMMAITGTGLTVSADRFIATGGASGNITNEASTTVIAPIAFTWKKLAVNFDTAPSSGKSRATISRVASVTGGSYSDQALTCTVSNTNTTCTDTTNSASVSAGNVFDWDSRPTGSPTNTVNIRVGAVMFIAPPTIVNLPAALAPSKFRIYGGKFKIVGGKLVFH
jgi:hypothetical protein